MRRTALLALLTVALIGATMPSAQATLIAPVKVLSFDGDQWDPYGNSTYLAFTSTSSAKPGHPDAIAYDRVALTSKKLNGARTNGYVGGIDPGTNDVIYQQAKKSLSDIYLYDLDTSTRTLVPGINTPDWEWDPRISTPFISFLRYAYAGGHWVMRVYLYTRGTGVLKKIANYRWSSTSYVQNGVVGSRYATWTSCTKITCTAYLYDTTTKSLQAVPTVKKHPQYAPVVDETNGYVYYVRSGFGCGVKVAIWRLPVASLGSVPTKIAALPSGVDADGVASFAPNPDTGAQDLLFSRIGCKKGTWGIWAVPGLIGP